MTDSVAKKERAELASTLARYERTAAFLPVYIYSARFEGDQIIPEFYSPVVERITGYTREDFLQDPWFWLKIVYPEDRSQIDEALRYHFHREHEVSEYRIVRKDGAVRWVRDQLRVSFNEQGHPTAYYGAVEDITDRKAMEAELAASEQRYRDLVETADDIILQAKQGLITHINTAGERFFLQPRTQLIGTRWLDLLAEYSGFMRPNLATINADLAEFGTAKLTVEFPATAEREEAIFEFKMTGIENGKICAVGRDITVLEQQRTQLTDAYLQLETMQDQIVRNERMVAMAQLAGTLMHEINNPLSVILGYAQMLPQIHDLPTPLKTQLEKIEEMSIRISEIIKQLDGLEDIIVEFGGAKILDLHRQKFSAGQE